MRKRRGSSIGWSRRSSIAAKAARRTAPTTSSPTIFGLPQPSSFPRISANTRQKRPALKVTRPGQSIRAVGSRSEFRTFISVIASVTRPMGTLTRKIHCQPKASVSDPADERADGDGEPGRGTPDAEGRAALMGRELLGDQGQRVGEHHRPAGALDGARDVQHHGRAGEAAEERGSGEDHEADRRRRFGGRAGRRASRRRAGSRRARARRRPPPTGGPRSSTPGPPGWTAGRHSRS